MGSGATTAIWAFNEANARQARYPWFIWVTGPWGAYLLVKTFAGRFPRRRR